MGLGTNSGEDAGVLQHLESRRRQWQDRESARVYEAERSEREEAVAAASRAAREREHRRAAQRLPDAHASKKSRWEVEASMDARGSEISRRGVGLVRRGLGIILNRAWV